MVGYELLYLMGRASLWILGAVGAIWLVSHLTGWLHGTPAGDE